jgi:hypothetical protein
MRGGKRNNLSPNYDRSCTSAAVNKKMAKWGILSANHRGTENAPRAFLTMGT